jgi:hypothetical protein
MKFRKLRIAWSNWRKRHTNQPYKAFGAPAFKFLGEPTGDVQILKQELAKILSREGNTRTAYLSRIQYPGEDKIRVALIIDGIAPAKKMAKVIATDCAPLVAIDILFFEDLFNTHKNQLQNMYAPFYPVPS